jgi:hypothetical protein
MNVRDDVKASHVGRSCGMVAEGSRMRKRRIPLPGLLTVIALPAVLTAGAAPDATRREHTGDAFSGLTATSIVSGVVARDGVLVRGARVVVVAWPPGDVLESLPPGWEFHPQEIGTARSDSLGRFSVEVDPASIPSGFRREKGRVDVEVTIADGGDEVRWMTTAGPARHPRPIGGGGELCGPDVDGGCDLGEPVYVVPGSSVEEQVKVVVATAPGAGVTPVWSTPQLDAMGVSVPLQLVADLGGQTKIYDVNDDPG